MYVKIIKCICFLSICFVFILVGCSTNDERKQMTFTEKIPQTTEVASPTTEKKKEPKETIMNIDPSFNTGSYKGSIYTNTWLGLKYEAPNKHALVDSEDAVGHTFTSVNLDTGDSLVLKFDTVSTNTDLEDIKDRIVKDVNKKVFTHLAEPPTYNVVFSEVSTYNILNEPYTLIKYDIEGKNIGGQQALLYKLKDSHLVLLEVIYQSEGSFITLLSGFKEFNFEGEMLLGE